ncbi:hypothetical protein [Haloprofundus halobius]|uniref:hypothetical protein n=1 Tax=Haloprofundus halobius TaxID=2876194 RepID=UPI001CCCBD25|nr:hypothetical protein [Haloprofundus halobius]
MSSWIGGATFVAIVLVFAILFGMGITLEVASSPEMKNFMTESREWCEQRDGNLWIERAVGSDGGLYCELPNGTFVQMKEVIDD